jgi:hypothetical protein
VRIRITLALIPAREILSLAQKMPFGLVSWVRTGAALENWPARVFVVIDPELIGRAEADHILGYLVKPIKPADLQPAIALFTEKVSYCNKPQGATEWTDTGIGHWSALIGNSGSGVGLTATSPSIQPQFDVKSANASNCLYYWPSSSHSGVLLAALGDGGVRSISQGISQNTFNIALVPNDGLPLPLDW